MLSNQTGVLSFLVLCKAAVCKAAMKVSVFLIRPGLMLSGALMVELGVLRWWLLLYLSPQCSTLDSLTDV